MDLIDKHLESDEELKQRLEEIFQDVYFHISEIIAHYQQSTNRFDEEFRVLFNKSSVEDQKRLLEILSVRTPNHIHLDVVKKQLALELVKLNHTVEDTFIDELEKGYKQDVEYAKELGLTATGEYTKEELVSIVDNSLKDYGKTLSEAVWSDTRQLGHDMIKYISKSILLGEHPDKVAKIVDSGSYRAKRLMITEVAKMQTEITSRIYKDNGIQQYQILNEPSACDTCKKFGSPSLSDAPIFDMSDLVIGVSAPPFHPNCRCSIVNYLKEE